MARRDRGSGLFFVITFASFALSSVALLLIPFISAADDRTKKLLTVIVAGMFWVGMAVGIMSTWLTNSALRHMRHWVYTSGLMDRPKLPGVITFTPKALNIIIYVIFIAGLGLMISDLIVRWASEYLMFPIISATLYVFVIHSVIDGKNYKAYRIVKDGMHNENKKQN